VSIGANLLKAAIGVVVSPVAIVVDLLTLPASSMDPHRGPFDRTDKILTAVGRCVRNAVEPKQEPQA
jgi:hypothetical protein